MFRSKGDILGRRGRELRKGFVDILKRKKRKEKGVCEVI